MICEGAPESNVKERLFAICWRSRSVDRPLRQAMLIMAIPPPSLGIEVRTAGHECRIHLKKQEGLLPALRHHLLNPRNNFGARHRSHATEVERAFPQKTGTAFDMMPKNPVPLTQWARSLRFGRTENRNRRNAKQIGQMHCSGIVGKQEVALAQFID